MAVSFVSDPDLKRFRCICRHSVDVHTRSVGEALNAHPDVEAWSCNVLDCGCTLFRSQSGRVESDYSDRYGDLDDRRHAGSYSGMDSHAQGGRSHTGRRSIANMHSGSSPGDGIELHRSGSNSDIDQRVPYVHPDGNGGSRLGVLKPIC